MIVHRGSILDLDVDAVVSPANSFGFMDGGIDHLYSDHFGWHVVRVWPSRDLRVCGPGRVFANWLAGLAKAGVAPDRRLR